MTDTENSSQSSNASPVDARRAKQPIFVTVPKDTVRRILAWAENRMIDGVYLSASVAITISIREENVNGGSKKVLTHYQLRKRSGSQLVTMRKLEE